MFGQQVRRGYFGLPDWETEVRITSTADFSVSVMARNVDQNSGGISITTPASDFRGPGSGGLEDGLAIDVPGMTGMFVGSIGGKAGEEILLQPMGNARVTIFVTVETDFAAAVTMTRA